RCAVAKSVSAGLVLVAIGLALMLMIGVDSSWTALLPGLLVTSLGTGLFNPTGSALALNALPDEQSGLAAGANDTFRQTGVAVGIAALGTLVPAGGGPPGGPPGHRRRAPPPPSPRPPSALSRAGPAAPPPLPPP